MIYNVENMNATTVMNILKNAESELPADHARDAAYMEIVREMMNCSTDNKLILGWALTYVSRSNVLVRKKASIEL
jgi:hypothetical protein